MTDFFSSEEQLTAATLDNAGFKNGFGYEDWVRWEGREVEGLFGVPDVVVAFGKRGSRGQRIVRTFAFEVKRHNWRRALVQAFRYAAFAHYSHVVLDAARVGRALDEIARFERANIGLISVGVDGAVTWHFRPRFRSPYAPRLHGALNERLYPYLFGNAA